jgi:hypothetical protein
MSMSSEELTLERDRRKGDQRSEALQIAARLFDVTGSTISVGAPSDASSKVSDIVKAAAEFHKFLTGC